MTDDVTILQGDVIETLRTLPDQSVHCCVTSPPYHGLRRYSDDPRIIGQEPMFEQHLDNLRAVFAEVWRVLRDDGVCWLNYGDAYSRGEKRGRSGPGDKQASNRGSSGARGAKLLLGGKPKDLMFMPTRVAIALQEQGWYVRSELIWHKPNPMPESPKDRPTSAHEKIFLLAKSDEPQFWTHEYGRGTRVKPEPDYYWRDRETYEELDEEPFAAWNLLGRWSRLNRWGGARYFYDHVAVRTPLVGGPKPRKQPDGGDTGFGSHGSVRKDGRGKGQYETEYQGQATKDFASAGAQNASDVKRRIVAAKMRQRGVPPRHEAHADTNHLTLDEFPRGMGANMRNVLKVATFSFRGAHFATYPPELIRPLIKAGTSAYGACRSCGAPWARATERVRDGNNPKAGQQRIDAAGGMLTGGTAQSTLGNMQGVIYSTGWHPTCDCEDPSPVPCTVLDPFAGSGTTAVVALEEGCRAVLCELKPEYVEIIKKRLRDNPPPAPWEGLL